MGNMNKYISVDKVKTTDDDKQIIEFVASKEVVDFSDDIVKLSGIDLSKIKKNKSLLFSHKQWDLPVGKILKMWVEGNLLKGRAQIASEEEYPFAATVYKLVKGGYLNNMSISFIPDYESLERKELKNGKIINIIHKSILLEVSICNIGCNPGTSIETKTIRKSIEAAWNDDLLDGLELNLMNDALDEIDKVGETTPEIIDYQKQIDDLKEEMEKLKDKSYIHGMFDGYKKSSEEKIYEELGDMKDPKEEMYDEIAKIIKGV